MSPRPHRCQTDEQERALCRLLQRLWRRVQGDIKLVDYHVCWMSSAWFFRWKWLQPPPPPITYFQCSGSGSGGSVTWPPGSYSRSGSLLFYQRFREISVKSSIFYKTWFGNIFFSMVTKMSSQNPGSGFGLAGSLFIWPPGPGSLVVGWCPSWLCYQETGRGVRANSNEGTMSVGFF
jgi:hypothetical protein